MFRLNPELTPKARDYILAFVFMVCAAIASATIVIEGIYIEGMGYFISDVNYSAILLSAPSLVFLLVLASRFKKFIKNPIIIIYAGLQVMIVIAMFVLIYSQIV